MIIACDEHCLLYVFLGFGEWLLQTYSDGRLATILKVERLYQREQRAGRGGNKSHYKENAFVSRLLTSVAGRVPWAIYIGTRVGYFPAGLWFPLIVFFFISPDVAVEYQHASFHG